MYTFILSHESGRAYQYQWTDGEAVTAQTRDEAEKIADGLVRTPHIARVQVMSHGRPIITFFPPDHARRGETMEIQFGLATHHAIGAPYSSCQRMVRTTIRARTRVGTEAEWAYGDGCPQCKRRIEKDPEVCPA